MSTSVLVALIGGGSAIISAAISVLTTQAVINWRLKSLEDKGEKTSGLEIRVAVLESQNKTMMEDIKIIKNAVLSKGE